MQFFRGYCITAELKVKNEDRIQEAKESLTYLCKKTLEEPGCTVFVLHHDAKQPTRFLLWECFDDEAAFKLHFEASHTKEYISKDLTEVVQYFQTDIVQ
jgi:4-carboxymuconolactone decarboxylase